MRVKYVLDKKDSGISRHCMMSLNMLDIETASARMHDACLRLQFIVSKPAYTFVNYIDACAVRRAGTALSFQNAH